MTYFLAAGERDSLVTETYECKHLMNKEPTSVLRVRNETASWQGRAGMQDGLKLSGYFKTQRA